METRTPKLIYEPRIAMNEVFIRRKNLLLLSLGTNELPLPYLAAFLKNIETFGFIVSKEVQSVLLTYNIDTIASLYQELNPVLAKLVGGDKTYTPMYPNFPQQVMEASDAELYINAILHYFGSAIGVRIIPNYEKEFRSPLLERNELRVLGLGDIGQLSEMFLGLMKSKTSISPQDSEDLKTYFETYGSEVSLPDKFNHKEVMTYVLSLALKYAPNTDLSRWLKTATDILRFATALSDGDVSLASNTKFISFDRKTRRALLNALNEVHHSSILEDMYIHSGKWIRLGERLHPGEYEKKYEKSFFSFKAIRENADITTFNGRVEKLIVEKEITKLVELLKTRPGVFARRLDHVLRVSSDLQKSEVVKAFAEISNDVATTVLLQVQNHFRYRDVRGSSHRIFFPKGSIAKMQVIQNDLPLFPFGITNTIDKICTQALWNNYNKLEPLGNVYVDPRLKGYNVPFSQRSASKAMRTIVRGSRIPLDKSKNTVRFFMWWSDGEWGRVDLDLSAIMFDENFNKIGQVSYTNLRQGLRQDENVRDKNFYSVHSGDIVDAPKPNGACEFIDIDLEHFAKEKGRYIAMNVHSYTGQKLSDVGNAIAGWMERESVDSGEIFDARTVKQRFDMTAESKTMYPLIIDIKEREIIWCDLSVKTGTRRGGRNVESNINIMTLLLESIVKWRKPNLYDLFTIHAESRGTVVDSSVKADFVFSTEEIRDKFDVAEPTEELPHGEVILIRVPTDVTPLDIEKIISEFL